MERSNYNLIDLLKYICAILVVAVHVNPLKDLSEWANFVVINIFGRVAVPFFFVCAGYFIANNLKKRGDVYIKDYMISLMKTYIIWSIIYLPFGILWVQSNLDIPIILYPIALIYAFFNVGTFYHLWYVPALVFSVLVTFFYTKKFSLRSLFIWGLILYTIGAAETYNAYLDPALQSIVASYMGIFFTTRNGLFYGMIFVVIGFIAAQDNWLTRFKKNGLAFFICFSMLIFEAFRMYNTDGYDFNFLFMLVPLSYFMFQWAKSVNYHRDCRKLRDLGSLYYFTHVMFIELIPMGLGLIHQKQLFDSGLFRFVSVMLCTHGLSMLITMIRKFIKHRQLSTQ